VYTYFCEFRQFLKGTVRKMNCNRVKNSISPSDDRKTLRCHRLLFRVHHHPPPPHPMDREPTKGDWGGGIEGYRRDWKWERDRKKKRECV
jgi:hypothetical protein